MHALRLCLLTICLVAQIALPSAAIAGFPEGIVAFRAGDYKKAYAEWLPAAKSGDPRAQANIGLLYRRGYGVKKNFAKAAAWYERAAEQDYGKAQYSLGLMHSKGQGVEKSEAAAIKLYLSAAENGYARAQYVIALRLDKAKGVKRDAVEALKWLSLCITNSKGKLKSSALKARKRIASKMSKKELSEAKKLIRAYLTSQ